MKPKPELAGFSDTQLLNELLARRIQRRPKPRPFKSCDDCRHFISWIRQGDPPADYNPCAKGHKMSFRQPLEYGDDDWGFYREPCSDRRNKPVIDLSE